MAQTRFLQVMGCIAALSLLGGCSENRWKNQIPFNSAKWKATADPEERARMVSSLLGIKGLPHTMHYCMPGASGSSLREELSPESPLFGKNMDEILSLLGEADSAIEDALAYTIGYLDERGPMEGQFSMMLNFRDGNLQCVVISD